MKAFIISLLFAFFFKFVFLSVSDQQIFYFKTACQELETNIQDDETILRAIDSLNEVSKTLNESKVTLDHDVLSEYVRAQSRISKLIFMRPIPELGSSSDLAQDFARNLLISMDSNHELFSNEAVLHCFNFVLKTFKNGANVETRNLFFSSHKKISPRLPEDIRKSLLFSLLLYASKSTWFLPLGMIKSTYAPVADIKNFMKELLNSIRNQLLFGLGSHSFSIFYSYVYTLSKSDIIFDEDTVKASLDYLNESISGVEEGKHNNLVEALLDLRTKYLENFPDILKKLNDLIMSEHVLKFMTKDTEKWKDYALTLVSIKSSYKSGFNSAAAYLEKSSIPEAVDNFLFYNEFVKDYLIMELCFSKTEALSAKSSEDVIKVALSFAKSLMKITKKSPNIKNCYVEFEGKLLQNVAFSKTISKQLNEKNNSKHMINELCCYFLLILFTSFSDKITDNRYSVLFKMVRILLDDARRMNTALSSDIYESLNPLIIPALDALIRNLEKRVPPFKFSDLGSYFDFIKLKNDDNFTERYSVILAYLYITSHKIEEKKYVPINLLWLSNESLALSLSFNYYLKLFVESGNASDADAIRHFLEYCSFKKALNKTEILISESILSNL